MITNGTVKFLRRVNLGNYEHKEASVELTVANPEGAVSSEQLEVTTRLAVAKAYEMLAEFKDAPAPFVPTTADPAPVLVAPSATSLEVPTPLALVGAPSAAVIATTSPAASTPPALVGNTPADATVIGTVPTGSLVVQTSPTLIIAPPTADPTLIAAPAAPGAASPALISPAAANGPAEITNDDLATAIRAANARMFARCTTEEQKLMVPRNLTAALLAHLPNGFAGSPTVQQIAPALRPAAIAAFNAL